MSENVGLRMPPTNEKLQLEEEAVMHGADLLVAVELPNNDIVEFKVKMASEVGYLKHMIHQRTAIPISAMDVLFNDKVMIDPMSLCDHKGVCPPKIDVVLKMRY